MNSPPTPAVTSHLAPTERETNELLIRCRHGDSEAFDPLFHRYYEMVYGIAFRILGNREAAEDATQDSFVKALSSLESFEGRSAFHTWLHRIAVTTCFTQLRRRRNIDSIDAVPEIAEPRRGSPQARLEVEEILAHLDPREREVLLLCEVEGRTYVEIAQAMGCSVQAVRSRLHQVRAHVRRLVAEAVLT